MLLQQCAAGDGEQGTSFQIGTATTGKECFGTTGNVRDRIACARADLTGDNDAAQLACEGPPGGSSPTGGSCHYNSGWQWTDGTDMNLPW